MYTITVIFCLLLGYGLGRRDASAMHIALAREENEWNNERWRKAVQRAYDAKLQARAALPHPLDRGANLLIPTDET